MGLCWVGNINGRNGAWLVRLELRLDHGHGDCGDESRDRDRDRGVCSNPMQLWTPRCACSGLLRLIQVVAAAEIENCLRNTAY